MVEAENWEKIIEDGLKDAAVLSYVKEALVTGYKNMGIIKPESFVEKVFDLLISDRSMTIQEKLEYIRTTYSLDWHEGRSIKDVWSDYYRKVEAPFISCLIKGSIEGDKLLEVGTGRGWVAYNLRKCFEKEMNIVQTDLFDYRAPEVKKIKEFVFIQTTKEMPFPFPDKCFDTAFIVYILHHLESKLATISFLRELRRITKKKIVILDDVYTLSPTPQKFRFRQASVSDKFHLLNEFQKVTSLIFSCSFSNRVDGGGMNVPAPRIFMEYNKFIEMLHGIFNDATITAEYLGIPETKVYLNSEGIFEITL